MGGGETGSLVSLTGCGRGWVGETCRPSPVRKVLNGPVRSDGWGTSGEWTSREVGRGRVQGRTRTGAESRKDGPKTYMIRKTDLTVGESSSDEGALPRSRRRGRSTVLGHQQLVTGVTLYPRSPRFLLRQEPAET